MKPSDVAIYVEHGAADIGVVGKDVLLETQPDVYAVSYTHLRTGITEYRFSGQRSST